MNDTPPDLSRRLGDHIAARGEELVRLEASGEFEDVSGRLCELMAVMQWLADDRRAELERLRAELGLDG